MTYQKLILFLKKNYHILIVILLAVGTFSALLPTLSPGLPYRGDNVPHYVTTVRIAEMFENYNFRLWDSDYNEGFPIGYYYQPLPYLITSILYIVLPFVSTLLTYKILLLLLFALYPITVYISMRWMNFDKKVALLTAFFSIMIRCAQSFGFEISSYLGWGLFTMEFGMVLLPLAIGAAVREYFGERKLFLPVLLLSITFLMHSFVGIAANVAVAILILFSHPAVKKSIVEKGKDCYYLFKIFLLEGLIVAVWLIPLVTTLSYYGGNPFDFKSVLDGLGADTVLRMFWNGILFDYMRIPIITILIFLGVLLIPTLWLLKEENAPLFFKQKKIMIYSAVNFIFFLMLLIGPMSFSFLRYFPGHGIIHFSRFFTGVDFFGIILAGTTIVFLADEIIPNMISTKVFNNTIEKKKIIIIGKVIVIIMCFYLCIDAYHDFSDISKTFSVPEDTAFIKTMSVLSSLPEGRVYPSPMITIKNNSLIYLIPLYTNKPTSISFAVGSQDSLGYFYADQLNYKNPETYNLLNIKYIFAFNEDNVSNASTLMYSNEKYSLYSINQSKGYFDLVKSTTVLFSDNKEARPLVLMWGNSSWISEKKFISIADSLPKEMFTTLNYTTFLNKNENISFKKEENWNGEYYGNINNEVADHGLYVANVSINRSCFVLLKVAAHKDWHVTVDGKEEQWIQMSPAFMAVPISEGNHEIRFEFKISRLRIVLLIIGGITLLGLWLYEKRMLSLIKGKIYK